MLNIEDLPVDAGDALQDAIDIIESAMEDNDAIDLVLVFGQLDPAEMVDGQLRWSPNQARLIEKAKTKIDEWESAE